METLFVSLCAVLVLVGLVYYQSRKKSHPLYPPGPPSLPLIGNVLQLGTKPHQVFLKWSEQYGNVFSFKMGSMDTIMLNDAKIIKDVFIKASSAGRTTNPVFEEISKESGMVMNEGPTFDEQKRFTMKTLRNLGWRMESKILEEANSMLNYFDKRLNQPINGNRLYNGVVNNLIWSILAGERTDWDGPEPPQIFQLAVDFTGCLNRTVQSGLMFAPFLRHIAPGFFGWTDWVASMARTKSYMKLAIAKHAEKLDLNNPMDFIDHYLVEIHNTTNPNSSFYKDAGERHLVALLVEFFLGGLETISHTMSWAIAHLACNPHVQKKLQAEIDNVVGQNRLPSLSDRIRLPYTEATLLETLRISSIVPNGFPHKMMEDDIICGFFFPKNCTVIANLYKIHHDPKTWGDPENFRPERFLSTDETTVVRHESLLPSSHGKRLCPGVQISHDSILLFFATILQKFDIKPAPNSNLEQVKAAEPANRIINEPDPFYIMVSRREFSSSSATPLETGILKESADSFIANIDQQNEQQFTSTHYHPKVRE